MGEKTEPRLQKCKITRVLSVIIADLHGTFSNNGIESLCNSEVMRTAYALTNVLKRYVPGDAENLGGPFMPWAIQFLPFPRPAQPI